MKGQYSNSYYAKSKVAGKPGTLMNVYEVSGSEEELEQFKTAQEAIKTENGNAYKLNDKGLPIYQTFEIHPKQITLRIGKNSGRVFVDNMEQARLIKKADGMKGAVGAALATIIAQEIRESLGGLGSRIASAVPVDAEKTAALDA